MTGFLTLSELPRREKEKVMLLLASADDFSWRTVHDPQHRLYIEWHVKLTHPVLSFLSLSNAPPTCEHPNSSVWRRTPRGRDASSSRRESPCQNGHITSDCSPWTIDLNNDSSAVVDRFPTTGTSKLLPHTYSPGVQWGLKGKAEAANLRARDGRPNSSQGLRGSASPFLNARSVFLRRQGRRSISQRSSSRPTTSWEQHSSRRNVVRSVSPTSAATATKETSSRITTNRSAQWVSRLVEDIIGYVSRMVNLDDQTRSVAALTVTVLMTRYGACQWNRVLRELAEGLHKYRVVCPLCRVFRELFINEMPSAMEDLFLLSQLYRATVRYSTPETQKVILPSTEEVDTTTDSSVQHTIVARRYLELQQLTAILNDMLSTVSIKDNRVMGAVHVLRRRKLSPAEIVGVKTIVAYWIEEESSNGESLAFDLGGFVDMHETLAVVVSALGSSQTRRGLVSSQKFQLQKRIPDEREDGNEKRGVSAVVVGNPRRLYEGDNVARKVTELPRDEGINERRETMSYAAQARLIMQKQVRGAENTQKNPMAKTVFPLSSSPWGISSISEKVSVSQPTPLTPGSATILETMGASTSVSHTATEDHGGASRNVESKLGFGMLPNENTLGKRSDGQNAGSAAAVIHQNGVVVSGAQSSLSVDDSHHHQHQYVKKKLDDPLIVDLGQKEGMGDKPLPRLSPSEGTVESRCSVGCKEGVAEAQAEQYLAALAAIDMELQRRRRVLNSTVALDNSVCDNSEVVPNKPMTSAHSMVRHTPQDDDGALFVASSVERSPRSTEGFEEITRTNTTAVLEEPMEPPKPPANASTFEKKLLHSGARRHSPMSILQSSNYQTYEKPSGRQGVEDRTGFNDMEMLTLEERELLADLQRALKCRR